MALKALSSKVFQFLKSGNDVGLGWPGLGAGSVVWWGPCMGWVGLTLLRTFKLLDRLDGKFVA